MLPPGGQQLQQHNSRFTRYWSFLLWLIISPVIDYFSRYWSFLPLLIISPIIDHFHLWFLMLLQTFSIFCFCCRSSEENFWCTKNQQSNISFLSDITSIQFNYSQKSSKYFFSSHLKENESADQKKRWISVHHFSACSILLDLIEKNKRVHADFQQKQFISPLLSELTFSLKQT